MTYKFDLFLIRGLPGSGKSTLAKAIVAGKSNYIHAEADQFRYKNGVYVFDPADTRKCHALCVSTVANGMKRGVPCIVVANTFTQHWEMTPYHELVEANPDYRLFTIDLFDGGMSSETLAANNIHKVPLDTIRLMRERWER